MALVPLPIDDVLSEIREALAPSRGRRLVLQAPPGAGKTTRVPALFLEPPWGGAEAGGAAGAGATAGKAGATGAGEVLVVEPRRLAARWAARRVADERGEPVGKTIGYEVRFDRAVGPSTRVRYITEGVLLRRLLQQPDLAGVAAVVLDEFHERHLAGDLGLALLHRIATTSRPDLAIVVMSATLDAGPVARFLDAPVLTSEGRRFPVRVEHLPHPDERPLASQVASAVRRLLDEGLDGDVLVFLPGAAEIHRATESCAGLAERNELLILPLHGDLGPADQDRAVRPADRRKLILSTNVAESSITIEGVVAVVDSGLARVARHDPWSGRPSLVVEKISRASAQQRVGRAGRLRPGRALLLYTKGDHDTRPEHDTPEVMRADLAEPILLLRALGVRDPYALAWLDAPPRAAVDAAESLLMRLGASDAQGALTPVGRAMLELPLPPRMARLAVEAERLGIAEDGWIAAAMLAEGRDLYARRWGEESEARFDHPSDVLARVGDFLSAREEAAASHGGAAAAARRFGLDPRAFSAVDHAVRQLERARRSATARDPVLVPVQASARSRTTTAARPPATEATPSADERLLRAVLAAYPDRVAHRRGPPGVDRELLLASGGSATLPPASGVQTAPWLVAVEASDRGASSAVPSAGPRGRRPGGARGGTIVWMASAIEPEWLIDLYPGSVVEQIDVTWNADRERVEAVERLMHERLVLDEGPAGPAVQPRVTELLVERAIAVGVRGFFGADALSRLDARLQFALEHAPDAAKTAGLRSIEDAKLVELLRREAQGKRSFDELRAAGLFEVLRAELGGAALSMLDEMAPESIVLAGGRRVKVEYAPGKPPSIASRLQDFFGSHEVPRLAKGRVPLVVHLLAPNGRDVQVTADLAGFWARTYPAVRSELARRYPRHAWPTDPLTARPPAPGPRIRR